MIVSKEYSFEAAHFIPNHPGKCSNLHGHSYRVRIFIQGPVQVETGMIMDFDQLDEAMNEIISIYDHRCLNDFLPLPTAENLAANIAGYFTVDALIKIRVYETRTAYAETEWSNVNA